MEELRVLEHPILTFPKKKEVSFLFEGEKLKGYKGEPIASALHANGIKVLRKSIRYNRPRGFFCAIGNCSSCLMVVDGEPNVRTCIKELKEGMVIERQIGKGVLS